MTQTARAVGCNLRTPRTNLRDKLIPVDVTRDLVEPPLPQQFSDRCQGLLPSDMTVLHLNVLT